MPVLDGTERLGVLGVDLAEHVGVEQARAVAFLVGLPVVSKRPHSDPYVRLVRAGAMNLVTELQWNLMPPRSFPGRDVVIPAAMESACTVRGDAFDYAVAGGQVHLAVFDAMGHNSRAGLAANLVVAACRNQRRQGVGLAATRGRIEQSLIEHFGYPPTPTASSKPATATAATFGLAGSPTSSSATTPTACPSRRPCAA
ncbi:hypothetical protein [Streptomyces sp. MK37H]|uniref:hypothetical protein n=1 Tax=Streptomyces sp. MK37H TaxID=2699117 RepID=UPI001FF977D9|nr:hypothetical protein [Streptomyces sp. MK37H]